jgi:hypothetical protein
MCKAPYLTVVVLRMFAAGLAQLFDDYPRVSSDIISSLANRIVYCGKKSGT